MRFMMSVPLLATLLLQLLMMIIVPFSNNRVAAAAAHGGGVTSGGSVRSRKMRKQRRRRLAVKGGACANSLRAELNRGGAAGRNCKNGNGFRPQKKDFTIFDDEAPPSQSPSRPAISGLIYNDGATEGYTLFATFRGIGTYLINNNGDIVQQWDEPDGLTPGTAVYFTKEGTLLKSVRVRGRDDQGGRIREYTNDGTCIWEFRYDNLRNPMDPTIPKLHHNFVVLPNGNVLATAREGTIDFTDDTIVEVSRSRTDDLLNPNWNKTVDYVNPNLDDTCQYVLDGEDPSSTFQPVWKWSTKDHLGEKDPYLFDKSFFGGGGTINFNHIDYLPGRDHILLSCNFCDEIFVIDHSPTTEEAAGPNGHILWRWGLSENYGRDIDFVLSVTHSTHWIYNDDIYGWSGFDASDVGSIILLNNRDPELNCDGCPDADEGGFSSIIKIKPPWNDIDKNYDSFTKGAFDPVPDDLDFRIKSFRDMGRTDIEYPIDSNFQGSAQLLPNGNIVMSVGARNNNEATNFREGDMYELIPNGFTDAISIWNYVNPYIGSPNVPANGPKGLDVQLSSNQVAPTCPAISPNPSVQFACNAIFRAVKFNSTFPGIVALNLPQVQP